MRLKITPELSQVCARALVNHALESGNDTLLTAFIGEQTLDIRDYERLITLVTDNISLKYVKNENLTSVKSLSIEKLPNDFIRAYELGAEAAVLRFFFPNMDVLRNIKYLKLINHDRKKLGSNINKATTYLSAIDNDELIKKSKSLAWYMEVSELTNCKISLIYKWLNEK